MTPFVSFPMGEDWSTYLDLDLFGWSLFILFGLVRLAAHMAQIKSIHHLGAPIVSTLMPTRLGSAFFFSVVILGEGVSSISQLLGRGMDGLE